MPRWPSLLNYCVFQVVLGFVCEADYKLVAKAMRDRVTAIKRQREKHRRLAEEKQQRKKEEIIEEESQPRSPKPTGRMPENLTPPPVQILPNLLIPESMCSPVIGSSDFGLNGTFPPEPEETEADQHFHIRHTSCSSATCRHQIFIFCLQCLECLDNHPQQLWEVRILSISHIYIKWVSWMW